jgi:hypothetical protein
MAIREIEFQVASFQFRITLWKIEIRNLKLFYLPDADQQRRFIG